MKSFSRALLLKSLEGIRDGHLELHLPDGGVRAFGNPASDLRAVAEIRDDAAFRRFAFGGDIAFGETYAEGLWSSPDLPAVTRLAARNMEVFDAGARVTATLDRGGSSARGTCCAATPSRAAARTSASTTTSARTSTRSSSTRR